MASQPPSRFVKSFLPLKIFSRHPVYFCMESRELNTQGVHGNYCPPPASNRVRSTWPAGPMGGGDFGQMQGQMGQIPPGYAAPPVLLG